MNAADTSKSGKIREILLKKILSIKEIFELEMISIDSHKDIDKQIEEEMQWQMEGSAE